MKLYIKRNPNELAELVFGKNCLCPEEVAKNFIFRFCSVMGKNKEEWHRLLSEFRQKSRVYLGECEEEELKDCITYYTRINKIERYLEIIE